MLIILDGWGHGNRDHTDAVFSARTPFVDSLYKQYPNAELTTHSGTVGLPDGQMGNSEVGHIHLGAGRVIWQELPRVSRAIDDGSFFQNEVLLKAQAYAQEKNCAVHVMGLVSKGGVHSHIDHCKAVCKSMADAGIEKLYVHAFTDGRDTDPHSGLNCVSELHAFLEDKGGRIASVVGRYYSMDRDKRWDRTKKAYDLMVRAKAAPSNDPITAVKASYDEGITDEFIEPIVIADEDGEPIGKIADGDVVICFNFRTDRPRQIIRALSQEDFPDHQMRKLDLHMVAMTEYDSSFEGVNVIFEPENVAGSFGEYIASLGLAQLRIAETEKYPHVTYFFSGGREEPFERESRVMIPSPKVATYDQQPEMSAVEVKDALVGALNELPGFVCLNFANPDMVGHTGVFKAAVRACETVDACLKEVVEAATAKGYSLIVTADHGNADLLVMPDGSPHTAHTLNPVPVFVIADGVEGTLHDGTLTDIAPTLCDLMGLEVPQVMTGQVLTETALAK